eukprot:259941_1
MATNRGVTVIRQKDKGKWKFVNIAFKEKLTSQQMRNIDIETLKHGKKTEMILKQGDFIHIAPGILRGFEAMEQDSKLIAINAPSGAAYFFQDLFKSIMKNKNTAEQHAGIPRKKDAAMFEQKYGIIIPSKL